MLAICAIVPSCDRPTFKDIKLTEDQLEILSLTKQLLDSITHADWPVYVDLCADDLSAFEPEAHEHLVEGLEFHKHYFDMSEQSPYVGVTTTISSPVIRIHGETAFIAYNRLTQRIVDGKSETTSTQETRIWFRENDKWQHVHFHRS